MSSSPERGGKRARTRARLITAAAEAFTERGFHATTLDEVASRAGMTKGAVYGNFRSKEALLLATFTLPISGVAPQFRAGAPLKEQMRRLGEAVVEFAPRAERASVRMSDLQLYAATHPAIREEITRMTIAMVDRVTERWRPYLDGPELPMPLRDFVIVADAVIDGLLIQRSMTPPLIPDALIVRAFEALA